MLCAFTIQVSLEAAMKLRLHFVVDPMGWLCISMVFGIWLYNTFFIPKLVLLPHYKEGHIPWAMVVCRFFIQPTSISCQLLECWLTGFKINCLIILPYYVIQHFVFSTGYYIASALCLAALVRASTADPGRLPVDPHIPHSGVKTMTLTQLTYARKNHLLQFLCACFDNEFL